jgi:hypothetical protein
LPKGLKELEKEVGEAQAATEFALVHFDINGVFDIFFLTGRRRSRQMNTAAPRPTVELDFGAPKNQPFLGFQAQVLMHREFELGFTLGSFEISRGNLMPN